MFFEIHNEKRIGFKKLSKADLGTSQSSHQTHIGLSEYVLTFLSDRDSLNENSIFIYDDKFDFIEAYFDRIENPNGTYRSPKIRTGDRNSTSVVSTIRNIVKNSDPNYKWFLVWFGLQNLSLVFFLFNDQTIEYRNITDLGINLNINGTHYINGNDPLFLPLMSQIELKVNKTGEEVIKELEIVSQIGDVQPNVKYKPYDIELACKNMRKTGREGEEFVNNYLYKELEQDKILTYTWFNKEKESGYPYDFSLQDKSKNVIYLDVKSTAFNFEQRMIFSSQEIRFIATTQNDYCIYRVYKESNGEYSLRICSNFKRLSESIHYHTNAFSNTLDSIQIGFKGAKLAISPINSLFTFKPVLPK